MKLKSFLFMIVLLFISQSVFALWGGGHDYLSPLSIVADENGQKLYVAQSTAKRIDVLDAQSGKVIDTIKLSQHPSGLVLSSNGKVLYVTGGEAKGQVFKVDLKKGKVVQSYAVGHTPMSPVLSSDEKVLYVCLRFDNAVAAIDLKRNKAVTMISVSREPVACGMSQDGKALFVANHLPTGPANTNDIAANVDVVDTASGKLLKSIRLPNGSSSLRGLCVSPEGKYVYVTHLLSRYTMPTTQLERGWMNTNAISLIDAATNEWLTTVLLDDLTMGAANPWAVACSDDGKWLCVTHAGSHEVSVIDRAGFHQKVKDVLSGTYQGTPEIASDMIPNTLSFFGALRDRVALNLNGPRGCVMIGSKVYVTGYFTENIVMVDLDSTKFKDRKEFSFNENKELSQERRGEMFFNDAALCFQQWQSCASCHPDGRADGLNWDLLNDGMGNPKSTKSMLYSHRTPPVMVSGVRDRAEIAVRAGIKFIQFAQRPDEDAQAIDAYMKSLEPVQSPYLVNGKLSQSALRGKEIFEKANCASCHGGELMTDLQSYDIGLGEGWDKDRAFDTPTLVEVWRTGPFLYDGRAATMMEVLTKYNSHDQHGVTTNLSKQEIEDLVEYVLSQ